jgi:hypothetical protein
MTIKVTSNKKNGSPGPIRQIIAKYPKAKASIANTGPIGSF